jgi:hypothetical protein
MACVAQRLAGQQLDVGFVVDQQTSRRVRDDEIPCPKLRVCSYCSFARTGSKS